MTTVFKFLESYIFHRNSFDVKPIPVNNFIYFI